MEEKPGKRNWYIITALLSLLLVGMAVGLIIWKYINSDPGYTVTKKEIAPADLANFRKKIKQMVLSYTVRHEGDLPVVHPPAGSDIYLLVSIQGWGEYILELEQGEPYRLKLATLDIKHTLAIRGLHLFNSIAAGELATIKFSPAKVGHFILQCGYICGPWHDSMNGAIIVVAPPDVTM
jgi:heme/copper-type cytochrome/quinol oxidase subunit 2